MISDVIPRRAILLYITIIDAVGTARLRQAAVAAAACSPLGVLRRGQYARRTRWNMQVGADFLYVSGCTHRPTWRASTCEGELLLWRRAVFMYAGVGGVGRCRAAPVSVACHVTTPPTGMLWPNPHSPINKGFAAVLRICQAAIVCP